MSRAAKDASPSADDVQVGRRRRNPTAARGPLGDGDRLTTNRQDARARSAGGVRLDGERHRANA